jgi:hypothetical protein
LSNGPGRSKSMVPSRWVVTALDLFWPAVGRCCGAPLRCPGQKSQLKAGTTRAWGHLARFPPRLKGPRQRRAFDQLPESITNARQTAIISSGYPLCPDTTLTLSL